MLRSTVAQLSTSVYSLAWGPDSEHILFSSGRDVVIKSLQSFENQVTWKAHNGLVLKVDWNPATNLVVTGGEDCRYKVRMLTSTLVYQRS